MVKISFKFRQWWRDLLSFLRVRRFKGVITNAREEDIANSSIKPSEEAKVFKFCEENYHLLKTDMILYSDGCFGPMIKERADEVLAVIVMIGDKEALFYPYKQSVDCFEKIKEICGYDVSVRTETFIGLNDEDLYVKEVRKPCLLDALDRVFSRTRR